MTVENFIGFYLEPFSATLIRFDRANGTYKVRILERLKETDDDSIYARIQRLAEIDPAKTGHCKLIGEFLPTFVFRYPIWWKKVSESDAVVELIQIDPSKLDIYGASLGRLLSARKVSIASSLIEPIGRPDDLFQQLRRGEYTPELECLRRSIGFLANQRTPLQPTPESFGLREDKRRIDGIGVYRPIDQGLDLRAFGGQVQTGGRNRREMNAETLFQDWEKLK